MRIAVLTFHWEDNCGAMLQAWALRTVLERMGHQVTFPVRRAMRRQRRWFPLAPSMAGAGGAVRAVRTWVAMNVLSVGARDVGLRRLAAFKRRWLPEAACEPEAFAGRFDCVVVGSDQVWNPAIAEAGDLADFLGETWPRGMAAVGYAVSAGEGMLDAAELGRIRAAMGRLTALSVRELGFMRQLGLGEEARLAPDPTLLLEAGEYERIAASGRTSGRPYLFVYTLSVGAVWATARVLAKRLGLACVIAPMYFQPRYRFVRGVRWGISPDRLVTAVRGAEAVLTDSFHGTVLSVLFGKPFVSVAGSAGGISETSRRGTLLRRLGLEGRLRLLATPEEELARLLHEPLPDCGAGLAALRREGQAFLSDALAKVAAGRA